MSQTLAFGGCRLDLGNESLWRDDERIPLRPKTFAVLRYLVTNSRRLVTKEELLDSVWHNVVVDEELLRGYVRELRHLLGDDVTAPKFIETVARRGYRFIIEVRAEEMPNGPNARGGVELEPASTSTKEGIRVGVLHSQTGMMAWTESPVIDATLLAISELNSRGGIRGRPVEAVVADGRSSEEEFVKQAEWLLAEQKVSALFGCWTSASRKAVIPLLERYQRLLFYPVQYEGMEASPFVVYLGAAPNQQILPAVRWAFGFLRARRFFLVGWDSIYSRAANEIIRDEIGAGGGEIVGDAYLTPDGANVSQVVEQVVSSRPHAILNSTVGDLNLLYSRALHARGITPDAVPTIYLSVGEAELLSIGGSGAVGDYAVWNYFQSLARPQNTVFIDRFRARYGPYRVTNDPMEAAYIGVNLWGQARSSAGTDDLASLRNTLNAQTFEAPEGAILVDGETQHLWKTVRVARLESDGQFRVLWSTEAPIKPEPFPLSRPRSEWEDYLAGQFEGWGRRWTAPQ